MRSILIVQTDTGLTGTVTEVADELGFSISGIYRALKNRRTINGIKVWKAGRAPMKSRMYRPVRCVETGEEYPTMTEAAEAVYATKEGIYRCLSGWQKTSGGYHWEEIT